MYQFGDNTTVLQDATKRTQLYFGLAWNICIGVNGNDSIRLWYNLTNDSLQTLLINIWNETNWCHCFICILLNLYMFRAHRPIFRRVRTVVHTTIGSVSVPHRNWTNGCVSSCTNSPEDGPVGPKHVEIRQYTNKIATSVGFHSICWKRCTVQKA